MLTFTPAAPLAVSTAYTVTASGFTDLAGNAVQAFTSSFTTGGSAVAGDHAADGEFGSPANAATNVAVASTVVVTFSEAVNPLTVGTGDGASQGERRQRGGDVRGERGGGDVHAADAASRASHGERVSVSGVTDLAGNSQAPDSAAASRRRRRWTRRRRRSCR